MGKEKVMNDTVNLDKIFFENNDINKIDAEKIVSDSLSGAEDGELYMQSSENESFSFDDGKLKLANSNKNIGFGLRSLSGEVVGYAHASEISKKAISMNLNGLMIETHNYPKKALSDANQQINSKELKELIKTIKLNKL